MATITVEGKGSFEVADGTKLVLALEDNGVDVLHRCGGNARCTTCIVDVVDGDPGAIGEAEAAIRAAKGIEDASTRLSCQVHVHGDLNVKPAKTVTSTGLDAGPRPQD